MNSSSDTWQGTLRRRASPATTFSMAVGPQEKISMSASSADLSVPSQASASSVTKGESLIDTIRTLQALGADFVVLDANPLDDIHNTVKIRWVVKNGEMWEAETMKKLSRWHWPGNIRELENFIERSVILTRGTALQAPIGELSNHGRTVAVMGAPESNERDEMVRILKLTNGRVGGLDGAAARLDIKRTTLISRLKRLGIDPRRVA